MSGVHWCYGGGLANDLGRSGLERKETLPPPCEMTIPGGLWSELISYLPGRTHKSPFEEPLKPCLRSQNTMGGILRSVS